LIPTIRPLFGQVLKNHLFIFVFISLDIKDYLSWLQK